jgi:3-oxoacyl-[acyl-carrier-protein] synthase-1
MYNVAITGIGVVSCLGNDTKSVSESLRNGKSGIVVDEKRTELGFRSPLTGVIQDFNLTDYLSRKRRKTMPDFAIHSYAAVIEALTMSGLGHDEIQNHETGLIFGCDSSCQAAVEQVALLRRHGQSKSIGSGLVFRSMNSNITMNLNTILKTKGACWTISSACSSSGHAIGQAADLIALGRQQRIICGGAQEINWESMCSFDALGAFSTRVDAPETACRPFDANRDGLVPSGGAAAIILERYDLAKQRGAKILGKIISYGFSSDGQHISSPSKDGLRSAMQNAINNAKLKPADIDFISAHATSTLVGDSVEATSISDIFGNRTPWISSFKSMTGHELWMTGASSVVYSVIMAQQGFIARNLNFQKPDKESEKLNIVTQTINHSPETVLCNSAGFGGTNSCLILRFDE